MRRPRPCQDLVVLHAVRLHHEDGLGRGRLLGLDGRAGAAVAWGFRVDGDAVPAAQIEEERVRGDGLVGVVPEERVEAAAGGGVDEGDVVAEADGDDFVGDGEDDGGVVGGWVGGGGGRGGKGVRVQG